MLHQLLHSLLQLRQLLPISQRRLQQHLLVAAAEIWISNIEIHA
jgi:hypothetical protein